MTPNQVIKGTMAQYGIVWDAHQDIIIPHEAYGDHSFLSMSKLWKFGFGEGCVGRAYASHKTIVLEDATTGANMFLRSGIAEQCGIRTIAFIPQENGSVLEVGFERKFEELPKSWWMSNLLDLCDQDVHGEWVSQSMQRLKTPSPEPLFEFRIFNGESGNSMIGQSPSSSRALPDMEQFQLFLMAQAAQARQPDGKHRIEACNVRKIEGDTREPSVDDALDVDTGKSEDELLVRSVWSEPSLESEAARLEDLEAEANTSGHVEPLGSVGPVTVNDVQSMCLPSEPDPQGLVQIDLAQHIPLPEGQMTLEPKMQADDPFQPMKVPGSSYPMKVQLSPEAYDAQVDVSVNPWATPYMPAVYETAAATVLPEDPGANPWTCSAGSIGHPYSCGGACKYNKTKKRVQTGCSLQSLSFVLLDTCQ